MNKRRKSRLARAGWRIGGAAEFLGLSDAEMAMLDVRFALSDAVRVARLKRRVTQVSLAKKLESSQSRVAKMEAGDPTVSLDLLMRALFVLGLTSAQIGRTIAATKAA